LVALLVGAGRWLGRAQKKARASWRGQTDAKLTTSGATPKVIVADGAPIERRRQSGGKGRRDPNAAR